MIRAEMLFFRVALVLLIIGAVLSALVLVKFFTTLIFVELSAGIWWMLKLERKDYESK